MGYVGAAQIHTGSSGLTSNQPANLGVRRVNKTRIERRNRCSFCCAAYSLHRAVMLRMVRGKKQIENTGRQL